MTCINGRCDPEVFDQYMFQLRDETTGKLRPADSFDDNRPTDSWRLDKDKQEPWPVEVKDTDRDGAPDLVVIHDSRDGPVEVRIPPPAIAMSEANRIPFGTCISLGERAWTFSKAGLVPTNGGPTAPHVSGVGRMQYPTASIDTTSAKTPVSKDVTLQVVTRGDPLFFTTMKLYSERRSQLGADTQVWIGQLEGRDGTTYSRAIQVSLPFPDRSDGAEAMPPSKDERFGVMARYVGSGPLRFGPPEDSAQGEGKAEPSMCPVAGDRLDQLSWNSR